MGHKSRHEQLELGVRKGNNPKVRTTRMHTPKDVYTRKQRGVRIERMLAHTSGEFDYETDV